MKAIALVSGGLDSTLATKIVRDLGVELLCLNTVSPFCLCNRHSSNGCLHSAGAVAKDLGLELVSIDVSQEILAILKNPKHGYGSNMNPCIDCRILLFKKAKEHLEKTGASFIITGEVLGQRPMSQKLMVMKLIEKESGLEGIVLRPLSAGVLEPTTPEKMGWVKREKLLSINGRGRKEQISLAQQFGINDYPCPSGGCLLTDREFSKRLKDLMKYSGLNLDDVRLLKIGRHFRLSAETKLIVGRNELENNLLEASAKEGDYLFLPQPEIAGPTALGRGKFDQDLLNLSGTITCRYCDLNGTKDTQIIYYRLPAKENRIQQASSIGERELSKLRI